MCPVSARTSCPSGWPAHPSSPLTNSLTGPSPLKDLPMTDTTTRAAELDAADPLAGYRGLFVPSDDVVAYPGGIPLGRPTKASAGGLGRFVTAEWASRLSPGWDESWYGLAPALGDKLG